MTNYIPTSNISNEFVGLDLKEGDNLYLAQGIVVASTFNGAIIAQGENRIVCDGTAASDVGVLLGDRSSLDIGDTGRIFGFSVGVSSYGGGGIVRNEGTINGGGIGVAQGDPFSVFYNGGTITAGSELYFGHNAAVFLDTNGDTRLDNDGLIRAQKAGSFAFKSVGTSDDRVDNAGTMIGKVALGAGNDRFDTSEGRVSGTIDGGTGNDVLIGSAFSDTFIGASGRDTFAFETALGPKNIDRIKGYSVADDTMLLSLSVFKGFQPGPLPKDAFKDITDPKTKLDPEDRILYNHDTGRLYYDRDGSGGAQKVQFAILENDPTITHKDFLLA